MPINRQNLPFELGDLTSVYERTLDSLSVKDRSDRMRQLIAKKMIEIARAGVNDERFVSEMTLAELGLRPTTD